MVKETGGNVERERRKSFLAAEDLIARGVILYQSKNSQKIDLYLEKESVRDFCINVGRNEEFVYRGDSSRGFVGCIWTPNSIPVSYLIKMINEVGGGE
jgi:hypothetical protein